MRDVTIPWSHLRDVPKPPIVPRLRAVLEPAILFTLMLAPLLIPLLMPALFLKLLLATFLFWLVFIAPVPAQPALSGQAAKTSLLVNENRPVDVATWCSALPQAGVVGRLQPL